MNNYYVYAYINKSTGLPYYIGKGKGGRAYDKHGRVKVPKDRSKIVFCETNLTNIGAYAIERRLIRWFGRKNIDENGILLNIQEGGEGSHGVKHTEDTRRRMSLTRAEKAKDGSLPVFKKSVREKISYSLRNSVRDFTNQRNKQLELLKENKHIFIGLNEKRVKEGTHNWQDKDEARKRNQKRIDEGTHNFLSNKGTVNVVDPDGNTKRIESATYREQKHTNYYVSVRSYEGQKRVKERSNEAYN